MELLLPLSIIMITILCYIINSELGLIVLTGILIFFREGWYPGLENVATLYKFDFFNFHVIELIVVAFFFITLIKKTFKSESLFLPRFTGFLILFFLMVVLAAIHGFMAGASLKSAFGYGEWRVFIIAMSMLILVPNILNTPPKINNYINWIYLLAFFRACQGAILYALGKGQIHATLKIPIVFWDSAENMLFAFLVICALAEFMISKPILVKTWLKLLACIPMLFSVIFSLRRNSWLQLIVPFIVLFILLKLNQKVKIIITGFFVIIIFLGIVVSGLGGKKIQTVVTRIGSFGSSSEDTNSFHLWDMYDAYLKIRQTPWIGVGFGNGFKRFKSRRVGGAEIAPNIVHNTYLHLWLKMGIFGLMCFLLFWFIFILDGYNAYASMVSKTDQAMILGILVNVFGILAVIMWGTDLVANTRVPMLFYSLFGVVPGMIGYYRRKISAVQQRLSNEQL